MQVLVEEMTQEIYKFISKLGFIDIRAKDGVYNIYAANTYGDLLWTGDASEQDIKDKFGEQLGALILTRVEDAQSGRIYQREIEPIVDKYKEQFSSFSKDKASELYKLAKKHFGTTTDMRLGLYLNVDGSMLKADGYYRARSSDHREIQEIMTEYDGSDAMYIYMQQGNIRLKPEAPGLELIIEPTKAQYNVIDAYAWYFANKEDEFYLEISNEEGYSRFERTYDKQTVREIVYDIKDFFAKN